MTFFSLVSSKNSIFLTPTVHTIGRIDLVKIESFNVLITCTYDHCFWWLKRFFPVSIVNISKIPTPQVLSFFLNSRDLCRRFLCICLQIRAPSLLRDVNPLKAVTQRLRCEPSSPPLDYTFRSWDLICCYRKKGKQIQLGQFSNFLNTYLLTFFSI